jgi:hypothetical protein
MENLVQSAVKILQEKGHISGKVTVTKANSERLLKGYVLGSNMLWYGSAHHALSIIKEFVGEDVPVKETVTEPEEPYGDLQQREEAPEAPAEKPKSREDKIIEAIEELYNKYDIEDREVFTAAGLPRLGALENKTGFSVSSHERDAVVDKLGLRG